MNEVFKAYDIRGLYPEELDEGIAYLLGRAFVTHTRARHVLVGNDMRASSEPLKEALVRGLMDQGATVTDTGLCSTPMFYYATKDADAGIMVTASHNPKQYNGFKLCWKHAVPIGSGSGMEEIQQLVLNQEFAEVKKKGTIKTHDYLEAFVHESLKHLKTRDAFTIVVDAANGMGGHTYEEVQRQLPESIKLVPLYWRLDGSFPNHEANPLKTETLRALQDKVLEINADLGMAIDGDGDRTALVDEQGTPIPAPFLAALISEQLLKGFRKKKILYDLRSSKVLRETIESHGGIPVESRVGHAFIKKIMRQEGILFGAEVSGHFYHKEMQYAENEIIPLCRVLNILSERKKPLSQLIAPFRKYAAIDETNFALEDREKAVRSIEQIKKRYLPTASRVTEIDGLKMEFPTWWFSLRLSNTEPLLRLNIEADTQRILKEKVQEITALIQEKPPASL